MDNRNDWSLPTTSPFNTCDLQNWRMTFKSISMICRDFKMNSFLGRYSGTLNSPNSTPKRLQCKLYITAFHWKGSSRDLGANVRLKKAPSERDFDLIKTWFKTWFNLVRIQALFTSEKACLCNRSKTISGLLSWQFLKIVRLSSIDFSIQWAVLNPNRNSLDGCWATFWMESASVHRSPFNCSH